jgi:hypothetical protein
MVPALFIAVGFPGRLSMNFFEPYGWRETADFVPFLRTEPQRENKKYISMGYI